MTGFSVEVQFTQRFSKEDGLRLQKSCQSFYHVNRGSDNVIVVKKALKFDM